MFIVNLFGVPSAGKSTGAAYIFSQLKLHGVNCELVTEFAKDKVWEENDLAIANPAYLFGNQYFRTSRCAGKVDVIVTDSPLLLSAFYNKSDILGEEFNDLVYKVASSYQAMNYLLERDKPYNSNGRLQTEEESNELVEPMKRLLSDYDIDYKIKKGNEVGYQEIVEEVLENLNELNRTHSLSSEDFVKLKLKDIEDLQVEQKKDSVLVKGTFVSDDDDTFVKTIIDKAYAGLIKQWTIER